MASKPLSLPPGRLASAARVRERRPRLVTTGYDFEPYSCAYYSMLREQCQEGPPEPERRQPKERESEAATGAEGGEMLLRGPLDASRRCFEH